MRTITQTLVTLLLNGISLQALALNTPAVSTTPQKTAMPSEVRCPAINSLQKNPKTLTWEAPNGWKGYEQSFADHITDFLGAQWEGANVGNIICIYHAKEKITFPILLHYNELVFLPTPASGKWEKLKGGDINCMSSNPKDCRFQPRPHEKVDNIYEEGSKLKEHSQQELGF